MSIFSRIFERGDVSKKSPPLHTPTPQTGIAAATQRARAAQPTPPASASPRPQAVATSASTTAAPTPTATRGTPAATPAATTTTTPAAPPVAAPRTYTVKPGDSLSKIAQQVYGNADRWSQLFDANRATIKDPNLIQPGQVLTLPDASSLH